jgi:hypothetical protein
MSLKRREIGDPVRIVEGERFGYAERAARGNKSLG